MTGKAGTICGAGARFECSCASDLRLPSRSAKEGRAGTRAAGIEGGSRKSAPAQNRRAILGGARKRTAVAIIALLLAVAGAVARKPGVRFCRARIGIRRPMLARS